MAACIIPAAPDFQDPIAAQNYAPLFVSVTPEIGTIAPTLSFSVTVTDPNVGDFLYYKWVTDYPPFDETVTRDFGVEVISPSADGQPTSGSFGFQYLAPGTNPPPPGTTTFTCSQVAQTIQQHRLELIVADRLFDTSTVGDLDTVPAPGRSIEAAWEFNLSCPAAATSP